MKPKMRSLRVFLMILCLPLAASAQQPGPIPPPPERTVKRIPVGKAPEAPPVPPEELIQKFTVKEDVYAEAFRNFSYKLTVRVVEYDANGEAAGEATAVSEVYSKPDGERVGRLVEEPVMDLKATGFTRGDLVEFASLPQFPLTTDQLFKYEITFVGRQTIDEISTYAFNVKPKSVDRRERRFEGVVWVDDRDFEVVKTYGRFVTEVLPDDPFLLFESYRELVAGMRLPTYVRSDGEKKVGEATVRLRLTLRYSDYTPPKK